MIPNDQPEPAGQRPCGWDRASRSGWLEAEAQHTSKQAITIAALKEYRERRDLGHVLALGARAAARHRVVLDRLADA
jgi:hypothetical protein